MWRSCARKIIFNRPGNGRILLSDMAGSSERKRRNPGPGNDGIRVRETVGYGCRKRWDTGSGKYLEFSILFRLIPVWFLWETAGTGGKSPENFRTEYCYRVPGISRVSLRDPARTSRPGVLLYFGSTEVRLFPLVFPSYWCYFTKGRDKFYSNKSYMH